MSNSDYRLISTREVAEQRGLSVITIGRHVRKGWIVPVMKLPGKTGAYLFDPDVIEEFYGERELEQEQAS